MPLHSLENLRCFLLASDHLNFRKAARTAALTPAAFGQRIRQLEEELGTTLFRRTTRRVTLTESGFALLPYARKTLESAEECVKAARGRTGPTPMDLILGTRHELGLSWIVPEYDRLVSERPWLHLHLYFGSGSDLLLRLRTMEVDCVVTSSRFQDPKLDAIRLHKEEYVLCAARARLERSPFARPEQAVDHALFDVNPELPLFRYWQEAPGGREMRFGNITFMGTVEAIRMRVLAGAGVAVLPKYLVGRELREGALKVILPKVKPLHDYFRLVFRAGDPRRNLFESLATSLRKAPLR